MDQARGPVRGMGLRLQEALNLVVGPPAVHAPRVAEGSAASVLKSVISAIAICPLGAYPVARDCPPNLNCHCRFIEQDTAGR